MLKKVLYILASFVVGFLLIMTVITFNSYAVLQGNIAESAANKNYLDVSKYFSGIFDYENKYTEEVPFEDGLHVEIYYSLFDGQRVLLNEEGKEVVDENTKQPKTYSTLESGIQVMIYHIPQDFKLEDTEATKGGVSIVFENGKELPFPFVISEMNNFYNYATGYTVIPFSISYFDYLNATNKADISADSAIKSIKVTDGSNLKAYEIETAGLIFKNELHNKFDEVITEYNEIKRKAATGEEPSKEVAEALKQKYNGLVEANPSYQIHYTDSVIYGSSDFLVPVILSAVLFLAIDILVAWLIFRKKKTPTYIPPYQQKTQVKSEPEQFNRDVFNVVDYDAEETEETPKNEE